MSTFGVLTFIAEILFAPHLHIPDLLLAINSNLLTLPMFEIGTVSAIIGLVLWRYD